MAGLQAVGGPQTAKEMTLNERLNRASGAIDNELDSMQSLLARVNETPEAPLTSGGSAPSPIFGLATIVDRVEAQAKRLAELVHGLERIA